MGFCGQRKKNSHLWRINKGRQCRRSADFGHHSTDRISECLEVIVSESLSPADATALQLMPLELLLY